MNRDHTMKLPGLRALATGCLLGTAMLAPAHAAPPGPPPAPDGGTVFPAPPPPHPHGTMLGFSVSDEAEARADTLCVHFSARAEGSSAMAAQQGLNQTISKAMTLLKDQPGVKSLAGNYTVGEEYGPHNHRSWVARQNLDVSSQNREEVLALAEKLQKLGLGIEDMQWTLNPQAREALERQARLGALKKLRQQAEEDAAALGQPLLGLEHVRIGGQDAGPFEPHPPMLMMATARSASPAPESTAEMQTIRVRVSAVARLGEKAPPTP